MITISALVEFFPKNLDPYLLATFS